MRRTLALAVLLGLLAVVNPMVLSPEARGDTDSGQRPCVLVLSAFPAEINPLLEQTTSREPVVSVDGRRFFPGRLRGDDVVLALTGIGLVNTEQTMEAALGRFDCIRGVVFSGVAGGQWIGDVIVADRWTEDGTAFVGVDPRMRATAARATSGGRLASQLSRTTPIGDPLCACGITDALSLATVTHAPEVVLGGDGQSTDPFAGERLPCLPGGGDIFGCDPCGERSLGLPDVEGFAKLLGSDFISSYFGAPPAIDPTYVAQDMETARAAAIAAAHGLPFIGFRGVSDGGGDPLGLPGFPVQFAAYRQLAADNAAVVTMAFLDEWSP